MITQEQFDSCFDKCDERHDACMRIRHVAAVRLHITMHLIEAFHIWRDHSKRFMSNWIDMPFSDEELARILEDWIIHNSTK